MRSLFGSSSPISLSVPLALGLLMATAFASPASPQVDRIQEIDVTADLTVIQNADAARFWSTLETDLETEITRQVVDRLSEQGARILIDIEEVELASAFERELGLGDAVLVGQVNIVDNTDNSNFNSYLLTVSLGTTRMALPEGQRVVLSIDDVTTYRLLVEAFAAQVVQRLG